MTDYLLLFVGTVLVNNFVLVKFLGLCPFMGVSKKLETAMGMGLATTFVMTLASICAWLMNHLDPHPAGFSLSPYAGLYSGYCGCGAIYRNGGAQNQPGALSPAGYLPAADHHQLRGARRGAAEHQPWA